MTLRHIQVFLAVVDNGCSITRAAEQLHLAQPAVSQTIADMEKYYHTPLFDRLNRKLFITEAGTKLLPYARRANDDFSVLCNIMKEGNSALPIRIGASLTAGTILLPAALKRLRQEKNETAPFLFEVTVRNTRIIEQAILDSRIDIAVVEGTIASPDIIQLPIPGDTLCAVCTPDYRTGPDEKQIWILREKGSGTRALTDKSFCVPQETETTDSCIWSIENTQTIIELVKAGLGITVISRLLVQKEIAEGILSDCTQRYLKKKLQKKQPRFIPSRFFNIVYHKDKLIDDRMRRFIHAVQVPEPPSTGTDF